MRKKHCSAGVVARAAPARARARTTRAWRASGASLIAVLSIAAYLWTHDDQTAPRHAAQVSEIRMHGEENVEASSNDRRARDGSPLVTKRATVTGRPRRAARALEQPSERDGSLRGRVASTDGSPLPGAEVCLSRSGAGLDAPTCTTSDRSGAFSLEARAAPGDLLIASATAHDGQARTLRAAEESIDFTLRPARAASVRGTVVDASGGAVPRALVLARRPGALEPVASARSDDDGRFGVTLEPGAATLEARAEAYAPSRLEIEAPVAGVTLALAAASTLVGVVLDDATDEPVSGVNVSAYAQSALHPAGLHASTDEEGGFRLSGLHAGQYRLTAQADEWGGAEASATVGVAEISAPIELRVRAALTLTGVVRAGGEICPKGGVLLKGAGTAVGAEADANGSVTIPGIVPGKYEAQVRCPHGAMLEEPLEIAARMHREWDLATGATVRGRVESASGRAIAGRAVQMVPAAPAKSGAEPARARATIDCSAGEAGEFVCRGVEPGHYDFSLRDTPSPLTIGAIVIDAHDAAPPPVVLRVPPVASISVQLTGLESTLPATFRVLASKRGSDTSLPAEPTLDGYTLRDLPLGEYSIHIGPTSEVPATAPRVTLTTDGELARVSLSAPATLDISGVVLDGAGVPVPELWLHAESAGGSLSEQASGVPALTNERGEFQLRGLIAGAYAIIGGDDAEPRQLAASVRAGERELVLRLAE
jgi:protocatechuate 3,4-dioxygenase beta subunit